MSDTRALKIRPTAGVEAPAETGADLAARQGQQDALLSPVQAAAVLNVSPLTLEKWRMRGGGPAFVKLGARLTRYRRRDLESWVEGQVRANTAQ